MNLGPLELEISRGLLVLGAVSGMTYGILAVGLVLVYRSSRVLNFAHGEIGAFGAALTGVAAVRWGLPYWVALALGVVVAAGAGAGAEVAVVRRLRHAPKLMSVVATLGVAQFLLAMSSVINSQASSGDTFPQPSGLPEFRVGALLVTRAYSGMLFIVPGIVIALTIFLRRSRLGLAIRASAANPERARMAGVSAGRMSTLAWALAGAVAALTAVLIIPTRGFIAAETLGPILLLRAFAPAVIARMSSLPVAFLAGIGVGVVDQILIFNYPTSGVSEVALLVVIAVALLFQSRRGGRLEERQDWSLLQPWGPLPTAMREVWAIRNLGRFTIGALAIIAVMVGLAATNATAVTLVFIVVFSLIGMSLGIVTGLGGQLSLGQFAFVGVGATVAHQITESFGAGSFVFALVYGALAGAAASLVLGIPALRVQGLLLAVVTLGFAVVSQRWLLGQEWALGSGVIPLRPVVGPFALDNARQYYFASLVVLAIGYWLARNVWRGGIGLRLRAVRDNEDGARSFGISPTAVKLHGFGIAGLLAGLAGATFGHLLSRLAPDTFDVVTSFRLVALTVLGGIGLLEGPVLGALYIIGLPKFLPLDSAGLAASALGWLVLILYFPGGIAQLVAIPRKRLIEWLARRAGIDPDADAAETAVTTSGLPSVQLRTSQRHNTGHAVLLEGIELTKHYGGVSALDGVSVELHDGEILGLMGPNGAGKTTLFEVLSGFTRPQHGSVRYLGDDVTAATPEMRARAGLIRSFQDAALFTTLTVLETVSLSYERLAPTSLALSVVGVHRSEARKRDAALELVHSMGLGSYVDRQIRELSTGTRRIVELACVVALEPNVVLLDEPSSGIAQRETEALGEVLLQLQEHLGCSMILIEHDIPLLMGLSSRVVAMDAGQVIASGTPSEVRNSPLVVSSYLGTDDVAVERSAGVRTKDVAAMGRQG